MREDVLSKAIHSMWGFDCNHRIFQSKPFTLSHFTEQKLLLGVFQIDYNLSVFIFYAFNEMLLTLPKETLYIRTILKLFHN